MSTLAVRNKFVDIARRNVGRKESSRNRAEWIGPLWAATSYPDGMKDREPYCAAGVAWTMREWLRLPEARAAMGFTEAQAEAWRCKSASCFKNGADSWLGWSRKNRYTVPLDKLVFHTADLVIYRFSHIEIFTGDLPGGRFTSVGYNTNAAGSRDGDGCAEKPRSRDDILAVVRFLP